MKRNLFDFIDTPNHIGFLSMEEDDTRRHRSRCNYFDKGSKECKHANSPFYTRKCGGSSHCLCYEEMLPKSSSHQTPISHPKPSKHISKYKLKKMKQQEEIEGFNLEKLIDDSPVETVMPINMEVQIMNFDTISRTIKKEFPKEVMEMTKSLNDIDRALSDIVVKINKQTGDFLQAGNTSAAINILKEYEPFINKISFNKSCIQKLIDQLS